MAARRWRMAAAGDSKKDGHGQHHAGTESHNRCAQGGHSAPWSTNPTVTTNVVPTRLPGSPDHEPRPHRPTSPATPENFTRPFTCLPGTPACASRGPKCTSYDPQPSGGSGAQPQLRSSRRAALVREVVPGPGDPLSLRHTTWTASSNPHPIEDGGDQAGSGEGHNGVAVHEVRSECQADREDAAHAHRSWHRPR